MQSLLIIRFEYAVYGPENIVCTNVFRVSTLNPVFPANTCPSARLHIIAVMKVFLMILSKAAFDCAASEYSMASRALTPLQYGVIFCTTSLLPASTQIDLPAPATAGVPKTGPATNSPPAFSTILASLAVGLGFAVCDSFGDLRAANGVRKVSGWLGGAIPDDEIVRKVALLGKVLAHSLRSLRI